ncbi:SDR family NAD(P)-dependent oxidoreductase [Kallotenue papyrolyticum]|uniref:SDR family NAD(P)-dependent oxidoreductase n=1 Tax=Kallotenue papyrolyticum TaxID=1325125 RepID=UPI000478586C|nr:SDR family NAD(P)-dependent oxidoreductase [Kallotenue papyrolyticum]
MPETPRETIVLPGATGGLGPAVLRRLLPHYRCVALSRSAEALQRLQAELGQPAELHGLQVDLQDDTALSAAMARLGATWGPIYGLVYLVGGFEGGALADTSRETWQRMFDAHVHGAFNAIRAVLPQMRRQRRGRIVAISSAAVLTKPAGLAAYLVAKSALVSLIEVVAREHSAEGITANVLLPAALDTPAMRQVEDRQRLVPLERVAETIAFLLSAEAASITGAALPLTITGDAA